MFSDPRAMRYWSTPPHESLQDTRRFVQAMIEAPEDQGCDFIIEFEGRAVGKAGCWRLPEVGYILHPDLWGRGLAREALEAAIARVFERFDVAALTADVDPRNARSIALLHRLGFRETGRAERTWHIAGEWCDSLYLELPRSDRGRSDADEGHRDMEPCDKEKVTQFDYSRLSRSFAGLSKPAQRALINNSIFTVNDLAAWTRADLAKLHGVGPSVFPKLDIILAADGLKLRD